MLVSTRAGSMYRKSVPSIAPATIDTYDDHRMAMSFAILGLRHEGIVINDPGCVNKTFPDFFEYLNRLGESP